MSAEATTRRRVSQLVGGPIDLAETRCHLAVSGEDSMKELAFHV